VHALIMHRCPGVFSTGCCFTYLVFLTTVTAQERAEAVDLSNEEMLTFIANQQAVTTADYEAGHYLSALGNRLAAATPAARPYQFRFILYDDGQTLYVPWYGTLTRYKQISSQINILPGGIVLVPLSLFDVKATESEFAAAMSRGIAHVVMKHFERFLSQSPIVIPIPPAGVQPPLGPFTPALLFPRAFENEADFAAMGILAAAHFNPVALIRYVRNGAASFDTSDSRVQSIREIVSKLPPQSYTSDNSRQFEMLKARLSRR
jgi:hypothetical protein